MKSHQKKAGFTIVELLIAIALIGILSSLVIANFSGSRKEARIESIRATLNNMGSQASLYYRAGYSYEGLCRDQQIIRMVEGLSGLADSAACRTQTDRYGDENLAGVAAFDEVAYGFIAELDDTQYIFSRDGFETIASSDDVPDDDDPSENTEESDTTEEDDDSNESSETGGSIASATASASGGVAVFGGFQDTQQGSVYTISIDGVEYARATSDGSAENIVDNLITRLESSVPSGFVVESRAADEIAIDGGYENSYMYEMTADGDSSIRVTSESAESTF